MSDPFDPYRRWLGISSQDRPPTHYRLLGLDEFENDPDVIRGAAERQVAHVRKYQLGQHAEVSQKLLNELAAAAACLLSPKKAEYDRQLREKRGLAPLPTAEPPPALAGRSGEQAASQPPPPLPPSVSSGGGPGPPVAVAVKPAGPKRPSVPPSESAEPSEPAIHWLPIGNNQWWAVAATAVFLVGLATHYAVSSRAAGSMAGEAWQAAEARAASVEEQCRQLAEEVRGAEYALAQERETGDELLGNVGVNLRWLELLQALGHCLPKDDFRQPLPAIGDRARLQVTTIDSQAFEDLSQWWSWVKTQAWFQSPPGAEGVPAAPAAASADGPAGPGYLIQLAGHHYHNPTDDRDRGAEYVRKTLLKNLAGAAVQLPSHGGPVRTVSMKELGVAHPVLIDPKAVYTEEIRATAPWAVRSTAIGPFTPAAVGVPSPDESIRLQRFDFRVQFVWKPVADLLKQTTKPPPKAATK